MMKIKNLLLGMIAVVAVAATFTSCLGDDDDDNTSWGYPSRSERATAFSNLTKNGTSGTATVYTALYNSVDTLKTPVNWQFTSDSTVVISGVPDSLFATAFAETSNNELRTAVNAGSPQTVTITGNLFYITYQGQVYIYLNPTSTSISVNYQDKTQTFTPLFIANQLGIGLNDAGKLVMNMGFGGFRLDDNTTTLNPYYGIMMVAN